MIAKIDWKTYRSQQERERYSEVSGVLMREMQGKNKLSEKKLYVSNTIRVDKKTK